MLLHFGKQSIVFAWTKKGYPKLVLELELLECEGKWSFIVYTREGNLKCFCQAFVCSSHFSAFEFKLWFRQLIEAGSSFKLKLDKNINGLKMCDGQFSGQITKTSS